MKPWRAVLEWSRRHPLAVDAAFAVLVSVGAVVTLAAAPLEGSERSPDPLGYAMAALVPLTLVWRRVHPLATVAIVTAGTMIYWVLDYPGGLDVALPIAFYSATRHGTDRRLVWSVVAGCLLVTTGVATVGVLTPGEDLPPIAILWIAAFHGVAAILGEVFYQREQRIAQLEARARALEAEVDAKAKLAALDERARIAREMHDVVAHGMSVVVVQAEAAKRLVATNPERAAEALDNIEQTGRASLAEMRRTLGVLRNPEHAAELAPQPSFADIAGLVDHAVDAGVDAQLEVEGTPRSATPGLELAAYRVLQEALTNVVQHAGRPVAALVEVAYRPDRIVLEVVDDGLGAAASDATAGSGHGLLGMRERVDVYDGTLEAGPRPGGGFVVRAMFPTAGGAVAGRGGAGAATTGDQPSETDAELAETTP